MNRAALLIPFPIQLPPRRGIENLDTRGRAIPVRFHDTDVKLIDEEAEAIGLKRSEMLRWICVHAVAIMRERRTGKKVEIVA